MSYIYQSDSQTRIENKLDLRPIAENPVKDFRVNIDENIELTISFQDSDYKLMLHAYQLDDSTVHVLEHSLDNLIGNKIKNIGQDLPLYSFSYQHKFIFGDCVHFTLGANTYLSSLFVEIELLRDLTDSS